MFGYLFKISLRNIMKNKTFTIINIFGLALGLAACLLVGLFIYQNVTYDNYHKNKDELSRLNFVYTSNEIRSVHTQTPGLAAPTIKDKYPEIKEASRVYFSGKDLLSWKDKKFYQEDVIFADPEFMSIFTYETVSGSVSHMLEQKNSIVFTASEAKKFFGDINPVGEIINLDNLVDLEVTGVIEDVPVNSHFTFSILINYEVLNQRDEANYINQWGATFGSYTYLLLEEGSDIVSLESNMGTFLDDIVPLYTGVSLEVDLQPIKEIHLYSHFDDEIRSNISIKYLITLGLIALLIIILACINFVNLSTAGSVFRAKEIGIKKVFGADRKSLILQFLCESLIMVFIALLVALSGIEFLKPYFNHLTGTAIMYEQLAKPFFIIIIFLSTIIIGLLAGIYPAFVLISHQPVNNLKGICHRKKHSASLRKFLVFFQYSASIALIIIAFNIHNQIKFMKSYDMGYNRENVLMLKTPFRIGDKWKTMKSEIKTIPGVDNCSICFGAPMAFSGLGTDLHRDPHKEYETVFIQTKMIDLDFLNLYDIDLVAGSSLDNYTTREPGSVALANETLVKALGFSDPADVIGHSYNIGIDSKSPEIVGVVKDFIDRPVHNRLNSLLLFYWPTMFREISIRYDPNQMNEVINGVESIWNKFYPEFPFLYRFLDERITQSYKEDQRSLNIISTFSGIAVFIACLGLLGLTVFTTSKRKKEIGIRKVLGASNSIMIKTLLDEFIQIILAANLLAWPLSYYFATKWLSNYAYKVEINPMIFFLAAILVVLVSILTTSFFVIRCAFANPVVSLRDE